MKPTLDQAALETSALPSAPGSLHASARSVTPSSTVRQPFPDPKHSRSGLDGDDLSEFSTKIQPDVLTAAPASSHISDRGTERASKRNRTDIADEDTSPAPKKVARTPKVDVVMSVTKSPTQTEAQTHLNADDNGHDTSESAESPVRPETQATAAPAELAAPTHISKTESSKAPKKSIATSRRRRACDACKSRKVKCKHTLAEDGTDENANLKKKTDSKRSTAKTPEGRKRRQRDVPDEPATFGASASNADSQGGRMEDTDDHGQEIEEEVPKKTKAKKRAVPKRAAAPPGRTSTRNRNPPERFGDPEEHPSAKATPLTKPTSKVFDPVYITTNSTSRLGKADMHRMLLSDAAWTSLSAEQQMTLVSMLPSTPEHQQLRSRIEAGETEGTRPWAFTLSNDCFRTDVAKFKEDLKNGHLAKTWQAAAEQAVMERAAGEYDAWKVEEAELWWGQKGK
ncbi:hypothetical protein N0V95_001409 [Ascochyta clinopodiicola]|nr:hypothetical protein N0V95_001409 [Ascochyta clinopodiicola]